MRIYLKFLLGISALSLSFAMALRVPLKLWYIDPATGFYLLDPLADFLALLFNITIAALPVILFVSSRLRPADGDYPVFGESRLTGVLELLTGFALLGFATVGRPEPWLEQGYSELAVKFSQTLNLSLGVLASLAFLYLGVRGVLGLSWPMFGLPLVFPCVWQVVSLITRFNSYTTVTAITDHLLAVLFMVSSCLFLIGQARTLCGHMRKDGRNYAIPAGLCVSLYGFLLVIPNLVYMAVHLQPRTPVAMLGLWECAYVLCMSVYALVFSVRLARSIKKV